MNNWIHGSFIYANLCKNEVDGQPTKMNFVITSNKNVKRMTLRSVKQRQVSLKVKMKFSQKLTTDTELYIKKKTGLKPDKALTKDFLMSVARLGQLLAKNANRILKSN